VANYRDRVLAEGVTTESELAALEQEINSEVEAGVAFAESSPDPKPQESTLYVYAEECGG
jgi:pyruvate dehydrogenase E1 component alpha subunit